MRLVITLVAIGCALVALSDPATAIQTEKRIQGITLEEDRRERAYETWRTRVRERREARREARERAAEAAAAAAAEAEEEKEVSVPVVNDGINWDAIAECESGQDWDYNGPSGYDGGLQFLPSTWITAGGGRYASEAWMATREQQIAVASTLDLGNWPHCSRYA